MPLPTWTRHPFNNASWIAVTMQLRSVQRPQHTQLQNLGTVQQQCLHMPVIYEITGALVRELISCFLHAVNGTFTRFLIVWQALSAHRHQTSMVVLVYHNGWCREALDYLFLMLILLHYLPNIKFFKSWFQAEFCNHHDGNRPGTDILSSESFVFITTKWGWELCHSDAAHGSGQSLKFWYNWGL